VAPSQDEPPNFFYIHWSIATASSVIWCFIYVTGDTSIPFILLDD